MSKFNIFYSPQSIVASAILAARKATGYLSIKSLQRNFFCISLRQERIEKSRWATEMMTKRCNKIGFNAMNNVAMSAFCAISGGGSLSASRAATRLAQQRNTAQLPRASSRSSRRFARHPARIVRALISAQFPRASYPQSIPRNFRAQSSLRSLLSLASLFPPCAPMRFVINP